MEAQNPFEIVRQNLNIFFSLVELRTLCFDLDVDSEQLPVRSLSKDELVRELLRYQIQQGRLHTLLDLCRQSRPDLNWPDPDPHELMAWEDSLDDTDWAVVEKSYLEAAALEWSMLYNESGLTIPLNNVYVMLQALRSHRPTFLSERSDVTPFQSRLTHAGLPLSSQKTPRPDELSHDNEDQTGERFETPIPLSQAVRENSHLVILGEPGSGKSTSLQFIGLYFASQKTIPLPTHNFGDHNFGEEQIPILISLRIYAERLKVESIEDVLASAVRRWCDASEMDMSKRICTWRDRGKLVLLIDGLDEIPEDDRVRVIQTLRVFQNKGKKCRIVITSRTAGYKHDIGAPFKEFVLKPIESTSDAIPYVTNWLMVLQGQDDMPVDGTVKLARNLVSQMSQQPGLKNILDNPLLLRLAVEIYLVTGEVIENRSTLYKRYTEGVAKRNAENRGADRFLLEAAVPALQRIAWTMHSQNIHKLSQLEEILLEDGVLEPRALLDVLREKMGLLLYTGQNLDRDVYFTHTTFQEYFVGRHLRALWNQQEDKVWTFLAPRLHHPDWREPILLMVGGLSGVEAGAIIKRVLNAKSPYEPILHRDLHLSVEMVAHNAMIEQEITDHLLRKAVWLVSNRRQLLWIGTLVATFFLGLAFPFVVLKWWIALPTVLLWIFIWWQSIFQARLPRIAGLLWLPARLIGGVGSGEQEKALEILSMLGPPSISYLTQLLQDGFLENDIGEKAALALGNIGDEAAISSLLDALNAKEKNVRRGAALALGKFENNAEAAAALLTLMSDEDKTVREAASIALSEINRTEELLEALRHHKQIEVRIGAAEVLSHYKDETVGSLLDQALRDKNNKEVKNLAAIALGLSGDKGAMPFLQEAINSENAEIAKRAIRALGKLEGKSAVPDLLDLLMSWPTWKYDLRATVIQTLGEIGDRAAVPSFITVLQEADEDRSRFGFLGMDYDPKRSAIWSLVQIGDGFAVDALIEVFKNLPAFRSLAVKGLGEIGDVSAAPILREALENLQLNRWRILLKDWREIAAIIEALGKIRDEAAVPVLLDALSHPNLKQSAVKALGEIGDKAALPHLLEARYDPDKITRAFAAISLGQLESPEAIPVLLKTLKAEDLRLHGMVFSRIMGMFPDGERTVEKAARILLSLLNRSEDQKIIRSVARAIWWVLPGEELFMYRLFSDIVDRQTFLRVKNLRIQLLE